MRRISIVVLVVVLALFALAPVASAHNAGHVETRTGCVNVGGGNHPPEGNAFGQAVDHYTGVHHAAHVGSGAVKGGFCL